MPPKAARSISAEAAEAAARPSLGEPPTHPFKPRCVDFFAAWVIRFITLINSSRHRHSIEFAKWD